MKFFQQHRLFIVLSLLLAIIDGVFVILSYTQAKHNLHQEEYILAQDYFAALDITYQTLSSPKNILDNQLATIDTGDIFTAAFNTISSHFNVNAAILLDASQPPLNKTPAINDIVIKQTTSDQIKSLIPISPDHQQINHQNTAIDVEIRSFNNHSYLYVAKSLSDYLGNEQSDETDVGQIVIWQDISELYRLLNNDLKINIYYAIAAFLIFELLMLLVFRHLSNRLKDIIEQQTLALNSRNEVLEQLVQGKPLATLLESIVLGIEQTDTEKLCSILLLDTEGKHLLHGAAPHLPAFYNEAINGVEIGLGVGSCGTAAFTRTRVIVEDIQTHPHWQNYKDLAAKANLGACWSEPIIGTNNVLLGSFAIYHHQPTSPSEESLKLIESVAHLAAVVIQHNRANEEHQLSSRVFSAAREAIMITDSLRKIITVNPMFTEITGYSREEVTGKEPNIISSNKHSAQFHTDMWHSVLTIGHWQGEVWNRKNSKGRRVPKWPMESSNGLTNVKGMAS